MVGQWTPPWSSQEEGLKRIERENRCGGVTLRLLGNFVIRQFIGRIHV
jgi:hypothetical protein